MAMNRWECLKAANSDISKRRYTRLGWMTLLPAFIVTFLIPALHGWPEAVFGTAWIAFCLFVGADFVVSYVRRRRAAPA
jgi:hypothetical protein